MHLSLLKITQFFSILVAVAALPVGPNGELGPLEKGLINNEKRAHAAQNAPPPDSVIIQRMGWSKEGPLMQKKLLHQFKADWARKHGMSGQPTHASSLRSSMAIPAAHQQGHQGPRPQHPPSRMSHGQPPMASRASQAGALLSPQRQSSFSGASRQMAPQGSFTFGHHPHNSPPETPNLLNSAVLSRSSSLESLERQASLDMRQLNTGFPSRPKTDLDYQAEKEYEELDRQKIPFVYVMLTSEPTPVDTVALKSSTVILKTLDAVEFAVPMDQAKAMQTIVDLLSGSATDLPEKLVLLQKGDIPIVQVPHVSSLVLSKILSFLSANVPLPEYDEKTYKVSDEDFAHFDELENDLLLQVALASNLLQIPVLLHIVGEVLAKKINSNDEGDINALFNVDALPVISEDKEEEMDEDDEWEEIEEMAEDEATDK